MTGRQQAALNHLKLVGRDVHRYATYALEYGLTTEQIKQAIADGVTDAEREEGKHGQTKVERAVHAIGG